MIACAIAAIQYRRGLKRVGGSLGVSDVPNGKIESYLICAQLTSFRIKIQKVCCGGCDAHRRCWHCRLLTLGLAGFSVIVEQKATVRSR
jgi:hypothetical protein